MIVRTMMTTTLVTVEPEETIAHVAHLFRQHPFHHLPVVRSQRRVHPAQTSSQNQPCKLIFQGLVTTQDVEMAVALAHQDDVRHSLARPWQERSVSEIMQHPSVFVTPTTSVAAAARLLVERGINCLPVIEPDQESNEPRELLVGLLTRSDILLALARALGADEPGTQISIPLAEGRMAPLAQALMAADELHVAIGCVLATPSQQQHTPHAALLRLSTINPGPLILRLKQAGVDYTTGDA